MDYYRGLAYHCGNLFSSILFLTAAAAQSNDPDPAPWILTYGITSLVCLLSALSPLPAPGKPHHPHLLAAVAGLAVAGALAAAWWHTAVAEVSALRPALTLAGFVGLLAASEAARNLAGLALAAAALGAVVAAHAVVVFAVAAWMTTVAFGALLVPTVLAISWAWWQRGLGNGDVVALSMGVGGGALPPWCTSG